MQYKTLITSRLKDFQRGSFSFSVLLQNALLEEIHCEERQAERVSSKYLALGFLAFFWFVSVFLGRFYKLKYFKAIKYVETVIPI